MLLVGALEVGWPPRGHVVFVWGTTELVVAAFDPSVSWSAVVAPRRVAVEARRSLFPTEIFGPRAASGVEYGRLTTRMTLVGPARIGPGSDSATQELAVRDRDQYFGAGPGYGLRIGASDAVAGPSNTMPSAPNREPCSGQSQDRSASFQRTMPRRCGQTAETSVVVPPTVQTAVGWSP